MRARWKTRRVDSCSDARVKVREGQRPSPTGQRPVLPRGRIPAPRPGSTRQMQPSISRAMGRLLLRTAIAIVSLGALLIAWVAGARSLSLLLDRLHTVAIDSRPIMRLGVADASGGMLQV